MSNKANSAVIGAFVIGAIAITLAGIMFIGSGRLFGDSENFVLYFDRSIQGLEIGAPMKLRGVKIGEVTDIESHIYPETMKSINTVYVKVNPDELKFDTDLVVDDLLDQLVEQRGLRAQLRIQSLLTGLLYIEVDFMGPDSPLQYWRLDPSVRELPTARSEIEELSQLANRFDFDALAKNFRDITENLATLTADPELKALAGNVNESLTTITRLATSIDGVFDNEISSAFNELERLARGLNRDYPPVARDLSEGMRSLRSAFASAEGAISNANHLLSDDSPLLFELRDALTKIAAAAEAVDVLADTVEREPESLIKGKSNR
jgi:paraquat-inducible protein B